MLKNDPPDDRILVHGDEPALAEFLGRRVPLVDVPVNERLLVRAEDRHARHVEIDDAGQLPRDRRKNAVEPGGFEHRVRDLDEGEHLVGEVCGPGDLFFVVDFLVAHLCLSCIEGEW
jgi:hypothetical protein